jgi:transcription elongation factor Elf1
MRWGKQIWHCPNCGKKHFDSNLAATTRSQAFACSHECGRAWEVKHANLLLGKDQQNEQNEVTK